MGVMAVGGCRLARVWPKRGRLLRPTLTNIVVSAVRVWGNSRHRTARGVITPRFSFASGSEGDVCSAFYLCRNFFFFALCLAVWCPERSRTTEVVASGSRPLSWYGSTQAQKMYFPARKAFTSAVVVVVPGRDRVRSAGDGN